MEIVRLVATQLPDEQQDQEASGVAASDRVLQHRVADAVQLWQYE